MEDVELVVVGCGPAGGTAAREAARNGIATLVLEKDAIVGEKRVCAAGLRPGFCETFDLPRSIVHCDTPRLALFDAAGCEHELYVDAAHTSTREELDGAIARLAREAGAEIRTHALMRTFRNQNDHTIIEYADLASGEHKQVRARAVFLAQGATAKLARTPFHDDQWDRGLMTTLQYRVYLGAPAAAVAYRTLELHYYRARDGRQIIGWMFPKRDHLAIGLGLTGKCDGERLRSELDAFTARTAQRLYPRVPVTRTKCEGHLLYGSRPRTTLSHGSAMLGGTAAGLVDATNGEGIFEAAMTGRIAAEVLHDDRNDARVAAQRFTQRVRDRFVGRLERRVKLMRFLERKPEHYAILFEELASSQRFARALAHENQDRSLYDRIVVYSHALRFAARAAFT
jgi:flavin-dependent dehydrogenase